MPSLSAFNKTPRKQHDSPLMSEDFDPEIHNVANRQVRANKRRSVCVKILMSLVITLLLISFILSVTYYLGGFTTIIRIVHTGDDKIQLESEFNPEALGLGKDFDPMPISVEVVPEDNNSEESSGAGLLEIDSVGDFKYQHCFDNVYIWCHSSDPNCKCPTGQSQSGGADISVNLNRPDSDVDQVDRDLQDLLGEGNWAASLSVTQFCVALCAPDFTPVQVQCEKLMNACDDVKAKK